MWRATKKYYAQYLSVYAIMIRIGIKSEIHECTIELIRHLDEFDIFPKSTFSNLTKDKQLRIDNQYYLKNKKVDIQYDELFLFVLTLKEKINAMQQKEIQKIREKLKKDFEKIKT